MSAIERHLAAIASGHVTKTNVIGIRKALNGAFKRERWGWQSGPTFADVKPLHEALEAHEPIVSHELDASGRKVLDSRRYRKRWTVAQRAIIDSLWGFKLVRYDDIGRGHHIPVYRAIGTNGDSFLFRNIPWQTASAFGLESGPTVEAI